MFIQDLIAKTHPSRITLTYATEVNGEREVISLPFRMLLLADFSHGASTKPSKPLEERTVQRLVGSNLNDLIADLKLNLSLTVPDRITALPSQITVKCTTSGMLGTAEFTINGTPAPKGDTTKPQVSGSLYPMDPKVAPHTWTTMVADPPATPPATPKTTTTTLAFDDDDGEFKQGDSWVITPVATVIANRENIGAGVVRIVEVKSDGTIQVQLPLTGMESFTPDAVANSVPQISALRTLRKLLLDAQADLDNRRSLRNKLNALLGDTKLRTTLRQRLSKDSLAKLRLLPPSVPPAPAGGGAPPTPPPEPPEPIDLAPFDPAFAPDTDTAAPASLPPTITAASDGDAVLTSLLQEVGFTATAATPTPPMPPLSPGLDELVRPSLGMEVHFIARLSALLSNVHVPAGKSLNKSRVIDAVALIDQLIALQLDEILHHDTFRTMAATWGAVENLVENTDFSDQLWIDLLDVSQEELKDDFDSNQSDIFSGALFKKVYIDEYDQYGGVPYGAMIGLYAFKNIPADRRWLRQMAKVANASHAPFISSVAPEFFGCKTAAEVAAIKDVRGLLGQPQYGDFSDLRDQPEAAYLGLALPQFMLRQPWNAVTNPADNLPNYSEVTDDKPEKYLWGNPAILVARNLLRSFNESGWCQYIRGPKGGGRIAALPAVFYELHDRSIFLPPVEITIPDYRELEFAQSGFIPLVYRKGSVEATFFSVQSIKRAARFRDPNDNQNAQLVTNLAYTFSITRIAHYIKSIMRDNIGDAADAPYIEGVLSAWISDYVTEIAKPDDPTVERFPFKKAKVTVTPSPRDIGRYDCTVEVLPHVQFEGMNVTLRLESRLGK